MGVPITALRYQQVPNEEVRVNVLQTKVVTRVVVLTFAQAEEGDFFVSAINTKRREKYTVTKIYYLHSNKIATACFLLGDGIDGQVMWRWAETPISSAK